MTYPAAVPAESPPPPKASYPHITDACPSEVTPFLKWPGGKRWLVEKHPRIFRRNFDRYIEPFLGAGSVYFHLAPDEAVLGDLNPELVIAYTGIKENAQEVLLLLQKHHLMHCHEHYYSVRDNIPASLAAQAARIIYLNRTCFNGIYRVNRQGRFNVPIGDRKQVIRDTDDFEAIAGLLAGSRLCHSDFEPLVDEARVGDLVFLDPPYTVRHNRNGFIKYNENLFSWDDQERLAKAATRAVERGAQIVVTNAFHGTVRALYSKDLFSFKKVNRYSAISAATDSRKHFEELVITSKRQGKPDAITD